MKGDENKGLWVISPVTDDPVLITPAQVLLLEEVGKGKFPTAAARDLGLSPSTAFAQFSRMEKNLGTKTWFETLLLFQSKRLLTRELVSITAEVSNLDNLDAAEKKMREVMFAPDVNSKVPEVVPWLLDALELLDRARVRIKRGLRK